MNSGYYAAFTGLMARMQAMDMLANNLANVNTTGFRGQHEFYQAVTASLAGQPLTPLNRAINDFGVLGGSVVDLRQGNLQGTGNNMDLGVEGPAFFAVQTAGGIRYTRNGSFHVNAKGQVVTGDESTVLGNQGPIQLPPGNVTIASDGTISVSDAIAGQVRLVEFAPGTNLVPEGNSNFIAPAGADHAATNSEVEQGMLESSNLNPVQATIQLIALQRHAELLERTLSIFQNDFNRTAIQQLAVD
jgi:flagellar basal-body rod protein FlgF/flagellar basal-body rod protein FlgG